VLSGSNSLEPGLELSGLEPFIARYFTPQSRRAGALDQWMRPKSVAAVISAKSTMMRAEVRGSMFYKLV
jgi:hypothetical protein